MDGLVWGTQKGCVYCMLQFMLKHSLVMPGCNIVGRQRVEMGELRMDGSVCGVVMGMVGAGVGEAGVI